MCYYTSAINRVQCSGLKRIIKKRRKRESYCLSWESKPKWRTVITVLEFPLSIKYRISGFIYGPWYTKRIFFLNSRIILDCQLSIKGGKLNLKLTKEHRFALPFSYCARAHTHTWMSFSLSFYLGLVLLSAHAWGHIS